MKKNSLKYILAIMSFTLFVFSGKVIFAQDTLVIEEEVTETPKDSPTRPAFESGLLFDGATTTIQPSKTLEMVIQHRFGTIDQGVSDLFGIWAGSNIRLAMNYSILDNLQVGVGTMKFNKLTDLQAKYNIIRQTRSNRIPVTVSVYGIMGIDGSNESKYGVNYKFSNRYSYFAQIIVSHRFNEMFSLQVAPGFTHYNAVDSAFDHDRVSLSFAGRIKFSPQTSFILSGDFPLQIQAISEHRQEVNDLMEPMQPNICMGFEIATSTHAFHIYAGSAQNILPHEDIMWNTNNFFDKGILIGLNVTRLWGF